MADFTLVALKDEIVADTEGLGYKNGITPNDWKEDQVIADLINAKNLVIDRVSVAMKVIRGLTEFDWYNALTADEQEWLRWQTPNGGSWLITAHMKLNLTGAPLTVNGAAGSQAVTDSFWSATFDDVAAPAMLTSIQIPGSRAEVLWDEGITISLGQVGAAFNEI